MGRLGVLDQTASGGDGAPTHRRPNLPSRPCLPLGTQCIRRNSGSPRSGRAYERHYINMIITVVTVTAVVIIVNVVVVIVDVVVFVAAIVVVVVVVDCQCGGGVDCRLCKRMSQSCFY